VVHATTIPLILFRDLLLHVLAIICGHSQAVDVNSPRERTNVWCHIPY